MNITEDARAQARVLKALGHPARLMVAKALARQDLCLCDLIPMFPLRQPTLSRHVSVLKQTGIVTERRRGSRLLLHLACPSVLRAVDCAKEAVRADHERRKHAVPNS